MWFIYTYIADLIKIWNYVASLSFTCVCVKWLKDLMVLISIMKKKTDKASLTNCHTPCDLILVCAQRGR